MSFVSSMMTQTMAMTGAEEKSLLLFTPHLQADISRILKKNMIHQSSDISGWDFDKKISVLYSMQDALEQPCFRYKDWGEQLPASQAKTKHVLLPVLQGQEALLDLWGFLMEYCDVVPVRTGTRALFLRLAGCICRRLEFVDQASINGIALQLDANGNVHTMNSLYAIPCIIADNMF